ncbi:class I SAM-dependent methyltransferase [Aureimonas sp. AU4]|uniref:class I SAM-dependent methyltransferase n=1 Tax=Aureimonas sp. AU4 TaxID=1638163 RepID=UPI0007817067|nr:class I SAM-dependent methyltransferase [Aureimonas sp. AU4]
MAPLPRRLVTERLDVLEPADPLAMGSRRDLVLVNRLMFAGPIAAGLLRRHVAAPPRRILEVGAGDGRFALHLAKRLAERWPGVEIVLLDRQDLVTAETRRAFAALGWLARPLAADVFALPGALGMGDPGFDCVFANLFLHHFEGDALRRLLRLLAQMAPVVIATEPHRDRASLLASRLLGLLGANAVTRHDAPASVRAGFCGRELSAQWEAPGFALHEARHGPFTQGFAAVREGGR